MPVLVARRGASRVFLAPRRAGGRLQVPLVADLDEVGNVVKLKQLPKWYPFFGSMGIVVSAYFQTRGQGIAMLKRTGWDTLQTQRRDIMSVAQLAELPTDRAWAQTSNGGGTIVRTVPWSRDKAITARIGNTVERIKATQAGQHA
ncbi:TraM recognition domain-containing protein [Arthrobacter sp. Z1-15]